MISIITLFIAIVNAIEIAPILAYSNTTTFDYNGEVEKITLENYQNVIQKSLESSVNHVVFFLDYKMNSEDFKEYTRYDGYNILRVCFLFLFFH